MSGVGTIFWKEMADYFGSKRFLVLFIIICLTGISVAYLAGRNLEGFTHIPSQYLLLGFFITSAGSLPSFTFFVSFFGPLIGIILGFDAISGERSRGTISMVLSQPVFRDSLINGKFLAGILTIAIMFVSIFLIILGLGIWAMGFVPNLEELSRIGIYCLASVVYVGFWLSLGILFSILFRRTSSSALTSIMMWIFFTFFIYMIANVIADQIVPIPAVTTPEVLAKNEAIRRAIVRVSPAALFEEIATAALNPSVRAFGFVNPEELAGLIPTPLSLGQSLMVVWPEFVGLAILMLICFAISYIVFMKQEIRSL
ncbi:MAG TPA: ABC transporter [Candidatus Aerophobetes bacterium]|uniref:ABC transporter n=1 Tax=Aerophobetes bacterium TaxID=2030807 RepID=A0A7V5HYG9_UNCAE|nr:ABC transporter [Candidatus Aerophobetes bacterium]